MITKSGLMVGLGETHEELLDAFGTLRESGVEVLTVGQYLCLQQHLPVVRYWTPEVFERLQRDALGLGFRDVAAGPPASLSTPTSTSR